MMMSVYIYGHHDNDDDDDGDDDLKHLKGLNEL